jgi:hypothetical protein
VRPARGITEEDDAGVVDEVVGQDLRDGRVGAGKDANRP